MQKDPKRSWGSETFCVQTNKKHILTRTLPELGYCWLNMVRANQNIVRKAKNLLLCFIHQSSAHTKFYLKVNVNYTIKLCLFLSPITIGIGTSQVVHKYCQSCVIKPNDTPDILKEKHRA